MKRWVMRAVNAILIVLLLWMILGAVLYYTIGPVPAGR